MNRAKNLWWIVGLLLAVGVVLLSPLASPHPDGLERVAEDTGFIGQAEDSPYVVMPDYTMPGIQNGTVSTIIAGVSGTLVVFGLVWGLSRILRKRTASAERPDVDSRSVTRER